jgi:hypothetical protein
MSVQRLISVVRHSQQASRVNVAIEGPRRKRRFGNRKAKPNGEKGGAAAMFGAQTRGHRRIKHSRQRETPVLKSVGYRSIAIFLSSGAIVLAAPPQW